MFIQLMEAVAEVRRFRRLGSFELGATARGLRSTLQTVDLRLAGVVEPATRRDARLAVGELVARWLRYAGADESMTIAVSVFEDRVWLDLDSAGRDRGSEFWTRMSDAPGPGETAIGDPRPRRKSGLRVELTRTA